MTRRTRRWWRTARAVRLMALETERDGVELPSSGLRNAAAALLVDAAADLSREADRARFPIRWRTERVVRALFRAVDAHLRLLDTPAAPPPARYDRRALVPPQAGIIAALLLATAHATGMLGLDPVTGVAVFPALGGVLVAVVGPALLVGRVSAELMALPGEPAPRTQAAAAWAAPLAICACVISGGVGSLYVPGRPWIGGAALGIAPLAVACVETLAGHPLDRADRARERSARRDRRRRRRAERRMSRVVARWGRAHRALRRRVDRTAARGDDSVRHAHLVLARIAARFGWRAAETPVVWPVPAAPDPLALPRDVLAALPPDRELVAELARRLRSAS